MAGANQWTPPMGMDLQQHVDGAGLEASGRPRSGSGSYKEEQTQLQKKLQMRPDRGQLVSTNILKRVPIDGSLQTRAIELEKQRNADSLQRQLQQRSGILELIKSGILPEPTVAEQLRAGNVNFQKTSDAFGRIDRLRQPASLGSVPENDGITTDEEVAMEDDEYSYKDASPAASDSTSDSSSVGSSLHSHVQAPGFSTGQQPMVSAAAAMHTNSAFTQQRMKFSQTIPGGQSMDISMMATSSAIPGSVNTAPQVEMSSYAFTRQGPNPLLTTMQQRHQYQLLHQHQQQRAFHEQQLQLQEQYLLQQQQGIQPPQVQHQGIQPPQVQQQPQQQQPQQQPLAQHPQQQPPQHISADGLLQPPPTASASQPSSPSFSTGGGKPPSSPRQPKKKVGPKAKNKKLTFHKYVPPNEKHKKEKDTETESPYTLLVKQQALYLRLQIMTASDAQSGGAQPVENLKGKISMFHPSAKMDTSTGLQATKEAEIQRMTVAELKGELGKHGLPTTGKRQVLQERLRMHFTTLSYSCDEPQPSPMSVADNMDRSPNSVSMLATDRPQSTPPYLDGGGGMDRLATADGRETFETRDHVQHFLDKPDDLKALNLLVPEHQRQMMEQVRKDMEVTQKKIDLAELAKKNGTERSEISAANGSVRQDTSQTNQLDMMASRPAVGTAGGSTKGGTRWSKDIRLSSSELNQTVNDAHAPKQTLSRRRSEVFATYSGDPSNHRVRKMQATSPPTKIRASRPYVSMSVPSSPYASQHNLDGDVATSSEHDTRFAMKAFGFPPFTSSLQPAAMTQQEQSPYHRPGHIRSASASAAPNLDLHQTDNDLDSLLFPPGTMAPPDMVFNPHYHLQADQSSMWHNSVRGMSSAASMPSLANPNVFFGSSSASQPCTPPVSRHSHSNLSSTQTSSRSSLNSFSGSLTSPTLYNHEQQPVAMQSEGIVTRSAGDPDNDTLTRGETLQANGAGGNDDTLTRNEKLTGDQDDTLTRNQPPPTSLGGDTLPRDHVQQETLLAQNTSVLGHQPVHHGMTRSLSLGGEFLTSVNPPLQQRSASSGFINQIMMQPNQMHLIQTGVDNIANQCIDPTSTEDLINTMIVQNVGSDFHSSNPMLVPVPHNMHRADDDFSLTHSGAASPMLRDSSEVLSMDRSRPSSQQSIQSQPLSHSISLSHTQFHNDSAPDQLQWLDLGGSAGPSTLEPASSNPHLRVIPQVQHHSSLHSVFPGDGADPAAVDPLTSAQFSIPFGPRSSFRPT